jgi:hypothetical protein
MSDYIEGLALRKLQFGDKVERASATLPQTAAAAIFNIKVGRVLLKQIIGEVTVIVQNLANNTKLTSTPTTGTAVDICTVLSIAADEVGCLYGITGLNSDAMIGINAGALPGQTRPVVLAVGTLDLNCAASNTGAVKWTVLYVPVDDGAYMEAA